MLQSLEEQLISLNSNKKDGKELANLPGRVFPGYKMVEILKVFFYFFFNLEKLIF